MMYTGMDNIDKELLQFLQDNFPIETNPWNSISAKLDIPADEVLDRTQALKETGILRSIGPILETDKVGLKARTLVLMKVPEKRLENVAKRISSFTEVTHNYERKHEYNLWFTVITTTQEKLESLISKILKEVGIPRTDILDLPVTRKHKIGVRYKIR